MVSSAVFRRMNVWPDEWRVTTRIPRIYREIDEESPNAYHRSEKDASLHRHILIDCEYTTWNKTVHQLLTIHFQCAVQQVLGLLMCHSFSQTFSTSLPRWQKPHSTSSFIVHHTNTQQYYNIFHCSSHSTLGWSSGRGHRQVIGRQCGQGSHHSLNDELTRLIVKIASLNSRPVLSTQESQPVHNWKFIEARFTFSLLRTSSHSD